MRQKSAVQDWGVGSSERAIWVEVCWSKFENCEDGGEMWVCGG